jgi:hypothetical protein
MSVITALRTMTVAEFHAELAEHGSRVRFLHDTAPESNGGFVVRDNTYYEGDPHYIADVREGWAGGVYEPICSAPDNFVLTSYLNKAAVWIDRGEWVRVHIEGTTGGPDEAISTR